MREYTLIFLLLTGFFPQLSTASNIIYENQISSGNASQSARTLEIRCTTGPDQVKISRISILDVFDSKDMGLDFGITTAHGVLDDNGKTLQNCSVLDFAGESYKIFSFKIAENYNPGSATDWALIALERVKKSDVVRYAFANPMSVLDFDKVAADHVPLRFSSARGLPDGKQNCMPLPRQTIGMDNQSYDGLLPHNCKAISGQSGAPLSISRGNDNIILGFHVGHAFWVGVPNLHQPAKHGYMRVLDEDIVQTIQSNVTALMERQ